MDLAISPGELGLIFSHLNLFIPKSSSGLEDLSGGGSRWEKTNWSAENLLPGSGVGDTRMKLVSHYRIIDAGL